MITEILTAAAHAEGSQEVSPLAIGLLAFAGLMALLFVTFAYRSVGTRH